LLKTLSVFKSVFIFPINLRNAQKYFGEATYLRTILQIRGFLCLPGKDRPPKGVKGNYTRISSSAFVR
jgi:hypothetical protein